MCQRPRCAGRAGTRDVQQVAPTAEVGGPVGQPSPLLRLGRFPRSEFFRARFPERGKRRSGAKAQTKRTHERPTAKQIIAFVRFLPRFTTERPYLVMHAPLRKNAYLYRGFRDREWWKKLRKRRLSCGCGHRQIRTDADGARWYQLCHN
jgi:hypothetical protein